MKKRFEYNLQDPDDVARFKEEQSKPNEEAWLAQVARMESDHQRITYEDTQRYHQLEQTQNILDNILKKLKNK